MRQTSLELLSVRPPVDLPESRVEVGRSGEWSIHAVARNSPVHQRRASRGALDLLLHHASGRARVYTASAPMRGRFRFQLDGNVGACCCWGCMADVLREAGLELPDLRAVCEAEALWVYAAYVGCGPSSA